MAVRMKSSCALIVVLGLLLCETGFAAAASVEERLDQVNRMSEKGRAEALEKEARKEGELVWYAAMASDRAAELIKGFETRHPFLKIRFQPGGAGRQLEQLLVEHRTKKQRADIINTRRSYVGVMAKAGAVARYRTPLRAALRDGFSDKEGFVNGIYAQPRVFLYNTRMIGRDKAPQSFDDLLDPRWKDKLGMDTTDYDWLASLIDYYGRGKALEYVGKLAKQQLNMRRGPTLLAQLALAGEFPVVIDAFPEEVLQLRNAQGADRFRFLRAFRFGKNTDGGFHCRRGAAPSRRGAVCRFSALQAGARHHGCPRALGKPERCRLPGRSEGQKNADSDRRMG